MNTRFAPATTPTPALYEAGGETFARCYLAQAHWPETDPLLLDQQTVPVSTTENARLKEAATRVRLDFEGFLNSSKYAKLAKCSTDTALRDIQSLIDQGLLRNDEGGGRSTSYSLVLG